MERSRLSRKRIYRTDKKGGMSQTKKQSAIESLTNIIVGLLTSFLIQLVIYPFLGIDVTIGENVIITIVFFVVSFVRGYLIRRFFNNK